MLDDVYGVAFFGLNDQTYPGRCFDNYAEDDKRALTLTIGGFSNCCNNIVRSKQSMKHFLSLEYLIGCMVER